MNMFSESITFDFGHNSVYFYVHTNPENMNLPTGKTLSLYWGTALVESFRFYAALAFLGYVNSVERKSWRFSSNIDMF